MIDRNEAPEGYYAVKGKNCEKCAFNNNDESYFTCPMYVLKLCTADGRPDKTDVIFNKLTEGI